MSNKVQLTDKECVNLVMATLRLCANDRELAYVSRVSAEYSHITDDGERMLLNTLKIIFPYIVANESNRVDDLMHDHLLKELK